MFSANIYERHNSIRATVNPAGLHFLQSLSSDQEVRGPQNHRVLLDDSFVSSVQSVDSQQRIKKTHTHKIKKTWCAKVTSCNSSSMITSQPSNCSSNTSDSKHSVCDVADLTPATSSCSACELRAKLHKVISSYITQRVL